ncbi:DNA primase [Henriciella litoralis]|uniref:DNA primase n=1 Tax=Henriciella litoralis TaxID=568102 RepID=UPI000A052D21|nr:DNA primase [Henriciella litoralis]
MSAPIRIPDGFVDELKARLRPSDVIGRKVKLKKQGKEWVGLSPFTNEKTPSFYVNDQKRIFKCFSSGMGGDVISFVMETERLSFMEAVEKLADEAGMQLPKATAADEETYDRRKRLYECCEAACKFYEDRLRAAEGTEAREYLEGRGLGAGAWARHRLGFAPDDWRKTIDHLKAESFGMQEIIDAGLAVQKEGGGEPYDRFRGRVIFPITDVRGQVIAFGGRGLQPDAKPKYLNSSDTELFHKGRVLYRYKDAREAFGSTDEGGLIVTEGYMDAIAMTEAGIGHVVAPLGTALTEDQLTLLWRAGPEPVLCFDGDAAGLRAADRSIERALPHLEPGRSLFFCLLSGGMDPDDLIRQSGPEAMRQALAGALPLVEVLWRRERDAEAIDTPERQAGLEARLMQAAGQIKHQAVRTAYERDLKSRMNDYLWQQRRARRTPGKTPGPAQKGAQQSSTPAKTRGLGLIVRAIDAPHLIDIGFETLSMAIFKDEDVATLRDVIISLPQAGEGVDRKAIENHLTELGKMRAAELLKNYPEIPAIAPDGPEEREWLIALEQYVARDETGLYGGGGGEEVTSSPENWRRLHHEVSERKARAARLNEAAEQADQD